MTECPPVISLRPLLDQELEEETATTVEQIESSLKRFGCVCLPVSDLDGLDEDGDSLLRRCYSTAERFFSLPEASKAVYTEDAASRQGYGGSCYTPLVREAAPSDIDRVGLSGKEPAYQEGEKQHVESFSCTRPLAHALCNHLPRGPELHKSLFPDSQVPGFGEAYSSLWEVLRQRVSLPMMRALEHMLCLPSGFLLLKSAETDSLNMSLLRTLRYPARDVQHTSPARPAENKPKRRRSERNGVTTPVDVGISEHTDFEVFTIMHQETAGLHLHSPSRGPSPRWYKLPFRHDTLTVILGDMMELWTSGWLEATRHKVVSPACGQGARRSFVLFQAHDDLVRIHPLGATHLAIRTPEPDRRTGDAPDTPKNMENTPKNMESCGGKEGSEQSLPIDSFGEWVRNRPKSALRKYRPITQGAWVRRQEFRAKSTLDRS
ncbi:unnamed protein product [Ectocarpus sp. CCAP 1310/34]|nr:unnamed protein product [Ectocarpus sp. CCAP 1310/34]